MPVDPRILKYYGILEDDPSMAQQGDLNPTQELETLYKDQPPAGKSGIYATDTSKYFSGAAPGFIPALNDSFAQLGTLHGKTSDTSPPWRYLSSMERENEAKDRQTGLKMKTLQYLQDQRQKNKDLYNDRVAKYGEGALKRDADATENQNKRDFDKGLFATKIDSMDAQGKPITQLYNKAGEQMGGDLKKGRSPKQIQGDEERTYRYVAMKNNAKKLLDLVDSAGTTGNKMQGPSAEMMDSLVYNIAVDYAKMVDPDSVAREGEVAAAQKYVLPIRKMYGMGMTDETAKTLIENFINNLEMRMEAAKAGQEGNKDANLYTPYKERVNTASPIPPPADLVNAPPTSPPITTPSSDAGITAPIAPKTKKQEFDFGVPSEAVNKPLKVGETLQAKGTEGQKAVTPVYDNYGKKIGDKGWIFKGGQWRVQYFDIDDGGALNITAPRK